MLHGKAMIIHLIVGLIKKTLLYNMGYSPELHDHSESEIKVEFDLPSYATKSDLKKGVEISHFAENTDLANLKSEVHQLDIDKLAELDADKFKSLAVDLKKNK